MIALVILYAFAVYLGLCILAVRLTMRWAKRTGRSARRWGIAAGVFMYLLVFWDHIPTLVLHKYYCATKAGFWVYKTPEQWKSENPGVAETLTWRENAPEYKAVNITRGYKLNERFVWVHQVTGPLFLPVRLDQELIVDLKSNETMTKRVTVSSGYGPLGLGGEDWRVLKFWVGVKICNPYRQEFGELKRTLWMMGREVK